MRNVDNLFQCGQQIQCGLCHKRKYDKAMQITNVAPVKPQVKITRLYTDVTSANDIVLQLKDQNYWLAPANFEAARVYDVETSNGTYKNVIINCDIPTQKTQYYQKKRR